MYLPPFENRLPLVGGFCIACDILSTQGGIHLSQNNQSNHDEKKNKVRIFKGSVDVPLPSKERPPAPRPIKKGGNESQKE